MTHRARIRLYTAALAVLALGACRRTPTDPSRPGTYDVTFIGATAGAQSFVPRAIAVGRVAGVAVADGRTRAVEWSGGGFANVGPTPPAGCHTEPTAARGAFTVGMVLCTASGAPSGQPVDAYGWAQNISLPARLFPQPYTFVGVNGTGGIAGTINPSAQFPQADRRAFVYTGGAATVLLPPGAAASEAVGISDAGDVAVTAYYLCQMDEPGCALSRAMVWRAGEWVEIPIPRNATRTVAAAMSPAGHVAMHAFGEMDRAYLYDVQRRDRDPLPVIPGTRVLLSGANVLGQVVGTGIRSEPNGRDPSYGIVWGDERQYDLRERLARADEAWRVVSAQATDDEGRIAGLGRNVETGQEGAILLTPTRLR